MVKQTQRSKSTTNDRARRTGAALLMCLFVISVVSSLLINVLDTEMLQMAETRNTIEYEQALYWANAGVHRACAELSQNSSWRGTISEGTLPPSASPAGYSVTASDQGSDVLVVSSGYSGNGARTVEATVSL